MKSASRILVTGAAGMLGSALVSAAPTRGYEVVALTREELDITDEAAVGRAIDGFAGGGGAGEGPNGGVRDRGVVVNAAAYTDVEGAKDDPQGAFLVNERGAGMVAAAARSAGLDFVHVSTDFVFDGEKDGPYREDDPPAPLSAYGASKLGGERAVLAACPDALIVRTAWIFGTPGPDFPTKILGLAENQRTLRVVEDEVGSPTYSVDLAAGILALVAADARGLFHLTAAGRCTRYELARETLSLAGLDVAVEPVTSATFPTKVRRPKNSVLDCGRAAAVGVRLPEWRDGLARYLARGVR